MPLISLPTTNPSRRPKRSARRNGANVLLTLGAGALMAAGVATSPAFATPSHSEPQKVTICHATGSETNPFVEITVADESIFEAHSEHQSMRDIVPAFTFVNSKGEKISFAGLNLTASGQAMLANGCVAPATKPEVQPPTPSPTASPSTAPMGAAAAQTPSGAAAAGPAEVTISAQTGAGMPAADYTVSAALLGSGLLTMGWVLVSTGRRSSRVLKGRATSEAPKN